MLAEKPLSVCLKHLQKVESEKNIGYCKAFFVTLKCKKELNFFSSKVFDRFYPLKHNRKKVAMETSSTSEIWIWV